jgi:DNA repair protein RecO (recombination protein O)
VAKRARRPKSPFGSGLERLSQVRMSYFQRETSELVNLDSCDLLVSQFRVLADYRAAVVLDYFAEITEQLLPPAEPNERFFRLLMAVLEHMRAGVAGSAGNVWRAAAYFSLWAARLSGFLPDLNVCLGCGSLLDDHETPARAFFGRGRDGLMCIACRHAGGGSWELSAESRAIAEEMLRKPIAQIGRTDWSRETCADLRRFLVQQIERHIERKLMTAPVLEAE